jgi:nucleoside-diphosphate-sugar epimerase
VTAPGRVLVTGASGFIGRRALGALARRGFEVHGVARGPAPEEGPDGVLWHAVDLLDSRARGALIGSLEASHLLHLAWYAEPGAFWAARENAPWVAASIGLVDEFAAAGGTRAVLAGTCAEYDWSAPQPMAEDAPCAPATYYGICKDATRRVVEGVAERAGVRLSWGRIFFLYGPHEDERRLVASVARALIAGERAPTSSGTQRRDFLHVEDVAAAFCALLDSDVVGTVNIASGEPVTVRSVVEGLALAAGRPELLDVGALSARSDDPAELAADVRRLRDEVGFVPAIGLRQGLEATIAWWRERGSARAAAGTRPP